MQHSTDGYWRRRFKTSRANAEARGIAWRLTFDEFIQLWGSYLNVDNPEAWHLARNGDRGDYELGNVSIKTRSENISEMVENGSHRAGSGVRPPQIEPDWQVSLEERERRFERRWIVKALEASRWNRAEAARRLSLSYRAMRYRLARLGIL